MRRYGSLKYGMTQYGLGTVEVGLMQSVIAFNTDYRTLPIHIIKLTDTAVFTNRMDISVIDDVRMVDTVVFNTDIRLKYVRVDMSDSIQFSNDTRNFDLLLVARAEDSIVFDEHFDHTLVVKSAWMLDDIIFSDTLHARYHWQQVSNPYDEIWVPRPQEDDVWMPRPMEADIWVPAVSATDVWVPRVILTDIWTPREQNNG